MNQSSIESSIQRYTRKRNSHDAVKTSFSLKNAKKSLPEVCIDLNQHHKKNKLALQQKIVKGNEPNIGIFQFNDPKKGLKVGKKKDQLTLKNMFNTQMVRGQDENKNVLNEYRDQIEVLKLENQRLKEDNQRLKRNQEYLSRRLKELKHEKQDEQTEMKQYAEGLERKVDLYSQKIKKLYEELITLKKKSSIQGEQWIKTLDSQKNNHIDRGQLYSYRLQQKDKKIQHGKRLTSPSPSNDRDKWKNEIDAILLYERRGQQAFYRMTQGQFGTFRSNLD